MRTLILIVFTVFTATFAGETSNAETLTLERALETARTHNPSLIRAQAQADEARWNRYQVLSAQLPKASLSASHSFNEKYQLLDVNLGGSKLSIPQVFPKTTFSLDAQWTIFDGLQTPFQFRASTDTADAAKLEAERSLQRVNEEIRLKFYQALAAHELAEVAQQNLQTLQDHLKTIQSKRKAGEATRFDTLRVQVQLEEAIPELSAAEDNVILMKKELYQSMGVEEEANAPEGQLPTPQISKEIEELQWNHPHRQDIEAAFLRSEASHQQHLASLGNFAPRISLSAEKLFYNNIDRSMDSDQFRDAYSVGILLSWSILDFSNVTKMKTAEYQQQQNEASARELSLKGPNEFEFWKRKYKNSTLLYEAKKRAIEAAQESTRLAKLGFEAGSLTNTEVLDAELDLFRARAGSIRAQLDAVEAFSNLELSLGNQITP